MLRCELGIDRWLVYGNSWGSTLALAYAERFPEAVGAIVLCAVTMSRPVEIEWLYRGVGRFFPEAWARFRTGVPPAERDGDLVEAYYRLLQQPNPEVREKAAREWCAWEDTHVSLAPGHQSNPRYEDPEFRLRFARLVTHYWRHAAFLDDNQLLRDASVLDGIPGVLICGRYDVSSPLEAAWRLSQRWSTSHLQVIDDAGHGGGEHLVSAIVDALIRLG